MISYMLLLTVDKDMKMTTTTTTVIVISLPHVSYTMIVYKNVGFELSSAKYLKTLIYFSITKSISF